MLQRLDKILSEAGVASRRELKNILRAGRVQVAGVTMRDGAAKFDPTAAEIMFDGTAVRRPCRVVLMLNKPAGYVTSTDDPRDKTVMELLPDEYRKLGLFPIGRLDKETEGLLLFTNDGALSHALTSPRRGTEKCYFVRHEGTAGEADVRAFADGLTLRDGTACRPAKLEILSPGECRVTVTEGKYHQVRRMMASRRLPVTYLKREQEGTLTLGGLESGAVRALTADEIACLELGENAETD